MDCSEPNCLEPRSAWIMPKPPVAVAVAAFGKIDRLCKKPSRLPPALRRGVDVLLGYARVSQGDEQNNSLQSMACRRKT
jgi:hypothetical protein